MRLGIFAAGMLAGIPAVTQLTADALPDEAPPDIAPKPVVGGVSDPVNLVVRRDMRSPSSRIVIPAKYVAGLSKAQNARSRIGGLTPARSIVAGIALSGAIAGVFLAIRRGRWSSAGATAVLGLVAVCAVAPAIADVPPPEERPAAKIVVEIAADGDEVVLIQGADFGRGR